MSLDDLVRINVLASTATPSKPGFGTILIAAQQVPAAFTSRVRRFGDLSEMTDFGFAVTDPAYVCAQKCKAQNPAITDFLVGKRVNKTTQTVKLKCLSAVQGDTYEITIGASHLTYTVPGSATTTTVATAIELLVEAVTGITSSSTTDTITAVSDLGLLVNYSAWSDNITLQDTTADPGLAADLAAITAATNQDWYGLALDSNSVAEIGVAALFTETAKKIFVPNNSDAACADPDSTTDAMSVVKTAAYARTGVLYSKKELLSYSGAAWIAKSFAGAKPGEDTWSFKTLAGINADDLSAAERSAILAKSGNFYAPTSDINITERGTSGAGEFLDIVRFIDWQRAEIQFRIFSALVNNKKLPYTDLGIDAIVSIITSALGAGVDVGGLEVGTVSVTSPKVAGIPSTTRATRRLSGIKFSAKLAGAIHELDIDGSLSP